MQGGSLSRDEVQLTFWEHVGELRAYALWAAAVFVLATVLVFSYAGEVIIDYLLRPAPTGLIFLSPLGPLLFKMKTAFLAGLIVSLPVWIALVLRFIGAALDHRQRVVAYVLALASYMLGLGALMLAYVYLVPLSLNVLSGFTVPGTTLMLTAESYLSFFLMQLMVSFVALELPVAIVGLSYLRLLDPRVLSGRRRYVFLTLLISFAVLTPTTDPFTLLLITVPGMALCEVGIALGKKVYGRV
jgi:sec-independent protein translocase protein TatC